jgi:putrescine transport system substrate-binding protein
MPMGIESVRKLAVGAILALATTLAPAKGELNILIWSDYFIGPQAVAAFGKAQDIRIQYGVLDSDDTLQARLLTGHSGYDVVYPSTAYVAKQVEAGAYEELDWSKIPNRGNLDPALMQRVATQDAGNRHFVPYVWGTDGIVINTARVREALGRDARSEGWGLLFRPDLVSRLHRCGVSMVDQASDVFPIVLAYMGRDPNSRNPADYRDAFEVLRKVRPFIDQFSSTYLNDLAAGDVCIAMGWSGDLGVIRRRAAQSRQKSEFSYIAPRGQTGLWFTLMAIPRDAPNRDNAYLWINHMIDVRVAADITNAITYPTAVSLARPMIRPELAADPAIFPPESEAREFFMFGTLEPAIQRLITKLWLEFKAGR